MGERGYFLAHAVSVDSWWVLKWSQSLQNPQACSPDCTMHLVIRALANVLVFSRTRSAKLLTIAVWMHIAVLVVYARVRVLKTMFLTTHRVCFACRYSHSYTSESLTFWDADSEATTIGPRWGMPRGTSDIPMGLPLWNVGIGTGTHRIS